MSDIDDVDATSKLRELADARASRGVAQVTVPTRDVDMVLRMVDELRDQLDAANRTIVLMQKASLLPEAYEAGRLAGVAEAEQAHAERLLVAERAVAGVVDDLAQDVAR